MVIVAPRAAGRIRGQTARWLVALFWASATAQADPNFVLAWGTQGSGPGQFMLPYGIAAGVQNEIYVTDPSNHRVQVFSSTGVFLRAWGSFGPDPGQFGEPVGIACANSGEVYVTDNGFSGQGFSSRIQVFAPSGGFMRLWGSYGSGDGELGGPRGLSVDSQGSVYVADGVNNRVEKFTGDGTFLLRWGGDDTGGIGGLPGRLRFPQGIAVGTQGDVYVSDDDYRIQEFHPDSSFVRQWGQLGTGPGEFFGPNGLAVDRDGNVYAADPGANRVQVFRPDGTYLTGWGSLGSGDGQFDYPTSVAVDSDANVYVVDTRNHRIQKFGPAVVPTLKTTWGKLKARFR